MNKIYRQTLIMIAAGLTMSIATDMLSWSFSGTYNNTGQTMISTLLHGIIEMPVKLMYATFNVIIGLTESAIKAILGAIGLKDTANGIHLHYLDASSQ